MVPTKKILNLPALGRCGQGYTEILEDERTMAIDQFPWTVLLRYRDSNDLDLPYSDLS